MARYMRATPLRPPWVARVKRAMAVIGVCGVHVSVLIPASPAFADIVIGVAGPMSGQNAGFGEQMTRGAQAAAEKINQQGGINGERLTVVAADDGCDAKRAVAVAQEFVAKDARFVVGHFCSGASIAAAETYSKADVLMLTPSASNPRLTDENRWNVLRLAARDDAQADAALERIKREVPGAKIAVVTDGTPGMAALIARFAGAQQFSIKPGAKAFPEAVAAVQSSGANAIYLACAAQEAGLFVGQLSDAGVELPLYGPDTLLADVYWQNAGFTAEGTLATFAADPLASPKAQSAIASFTAAGFSPEGATLPSFAAVEVFAAAAKAKSVNDGKAMAQWLKSGGRAETVLGVLGFDSKGDAVPPRLDWYRWSQGSFAREPTVN